MTIDEALKMAKHAHTSALQPEGKAVADAYSAGKLECDSDTLYLIAFLLHEVNLRTAEATS